MHVSTTPVCDIIMPVYNGLTYLVAAIESVIEHTSRVAYRLILVDDASDAHTAAFLNQTARRYEQVSLLRNQLNLGFVQSCIRGYKVSQAPFLLLLNSDVVVTPCWLERLLSCAATDERIAAVNPLTNHAAHLVAPMPLGANFIGMDALLRARPNSYPDVVTGEGFCMLLRRSALQDVGFFDPIFGRGYCEESDLCMRLTNRGYRTVAADNIYVYHRGSGTFGSERGPRYLSNRKIFDQRWSREYRRQFAAFRASDPLHSARTPLPQGTRWEPRPIIWQTGRALRNALRDVKPISAARALVKGLLALPKAQVPIPRTGTLGAVTLPGRLRVTYIIDRLLLSGGVLSVIQLVNNLILLGIEARIATLFEDPLIHDWTRLYTRPVVYRNESELIDQFPPSDIVVATLWTTASWAKAVVDAGKASQGVYFIQDYEPWFFPAHEKTKRAAVEATYGLISHRIVMSDWLSEKLRALGYAPYKIPLGMDLECFYPREVPAHGPTLTAMARPGTPYRGYEAIIAAFHRVKASRPEVRICLFGDGALYHRAIPFEFEDKGIITNQEHLARIYSATDIFTDGSDFQGFGRCGLEAMACGAACVLTNIGGVNDYARHDYNAILLPPGAPERFAEAILALLDDPTRRARLAAAGRETAKRFCQHREAAETQSYFNSLMLEDQQQ